jgi:DNA-directed RNA polymerase delta subunit
MSTFSDMMWNMRNCYQFENINMYDHGMMVHEAYKKLINQLEGGDVIVELPP